MSDVDMVKMCFIYFYTECKEIYKLWEEFMFLFEWVAVGSIKLQMSELLSVYMRIYPRTVHETVTGQEIVKY